MMTDNIQSNQDTAPASASVSDGVPDGTAAGSGEPRFVTVKELESILAERDRRNRQSVGDQMQARIEKAIGKLKAAGIEATPEQAKAFVEQNPDASVPVSEKPGQAEPRRETAQAREAVHPAAREAEELIRLSGVTIAEGSEAWKLIDKETDDPATYKASIVRAIARQQEVDARIGSPARSPAASVGKSSSIGQYRGKSGTQILEEYYRENPVRR